MAHMSRFTQSEENRRDEQTEKGAKVHDLQMRVMKAVDALYAEGKINTKDDKAIIEEAMNNIVAGGTEEIQQVKRLQKQNQGSMSFSSMSTSLLVYPMVPSVTGTTRNILQGPFRFGKHSEGIFMNTVLGT